MKKSKYIILVLFLTIFCSCDSTKINLYLGGYIAIKDTSLITLIEEQTSIKMVEKGTQQDFLIKNFYKTLDEEAIYLSTNEALTSYCKKAKNIFFTLGNYEINRLFVIQNNELVVDEEILRTQKEMFEYYLNHCIDLLLGYTSNIYILSFFGSMGLVEEGSLYNKTINTYNEIVQKCCLENGLHYVNIEKASRFVLKDQLLSKQGGLYIVEQIQKAYDLT